MSKDSILSKLKDYQSNDLPTKGGNVWAYVYDSGLHEVEQVAMEAYEMYKDHNGLDFTVFPSLLKLENEIIGEVAPLFSRNPETLAGTFTSGGTESIILAVKAARDHAREHKPLIEKPEIILPVTAHAAFHKAAHYLGLETIVLPVDENYKVDPKAVTAHITPNTIMLVGSSVNYSHGVSDPIAALGQIALKHDIWLHVDACIGGFLLAYFKELGHAVNDFDFAIPGVSSLSVDLHKYAFAPKGASVVLYRNKQLRRHQYYACTNWAGYPLINTTIQSTKSGGPLAACWATLKYIGHEGYKELARKIWDTKQRMLAAFETIEDVFILGKPETSLLAFSSHSLNLFQLADEMKKCGWYVQVQPGDKHMQPSIHLTITPVSADRVEAFFHELKIATRKTKNTARESLHPQFIERFPSKNEHLRPEMMEALLRAAGIQPGGRLPDEMASINELLRLLPHEWTKEAFLHIVNDLFTTAPVAFKGD